MGQELRHDDLRIDRMLRDNYLEELSNAISLAKSAWGVDRYVAELAKRFCEKFHYKNFKFLNSGTEALTFILWLLELQNKDREIEVIIPAVEYYSILSSFYPFKNIKIKLCEVNSKDLTIDTEALK